MFTLIAQATPKKDVAETVTKVVETDLTTTATDIAQNSSLWEGMLESDPLVKLCLLILVGFSVGCWAIIFLKVYQLKNAFTTVQTFWNKFSGLSTISEMSTKKGLNQGPMYEIFATGLQTINQVKKAGAKVTDYHRNMVMQRISQSKEEEVYKLEQYVSFLATTAAVAPFIGLLGTVWGILTAFMAIGQAGSSSLATVGPYISEALVATAVGLFAAIPAVIAYNYFVNKIRIINKMIELFMDDFMLKSERELAK